MLHRRSAGLLAGLAALALAVPAVASAAPVTVDLRIEGETRTLFEAPVTVDVRTFRFTGETTEHRCDGTASENQGSSPTPVPTRGAAIAQAAEQTPFAIHGRWFDSFGSPSFSEIAGEDVSFDPSSGRFLAEYENGSAATVGSCGDPVQNGDDVLFAYATGSEQVLDLTGPGSARSGDRVTVKVLDAATGAPVQGAAVGGATTGADGNAVVGPFTAAGRHDLKATKDGAIRSNRLRVEVTDATAPAAPTAPGGTTPVARDTLAPSGRIRGIRDGQRFSRRRAPRTLRGSVTPDPSGLQAVKLSLRRSHRGRCRLYSPTRERFRPARCRGRVNFVIGDAADWSYLLPRRLGPGRYVLDVIAIDKAGNRDRPVRGRSRVVFFVR